MKALLIKGNNINTNIRNRLSTNWEKVIMPKVSIITVCYNAEKTIERTILSVLKQTYSDVEYIIIDGKSTDATFDIATKYCLATSAGEYPGKSVRAYSEPDRGIYDAMNKGIQFSTGELIGIINADDWYELDAIERIVNALDNYDECKLLYGQMMVHTSSDCYLHRFSENIDDIWYGMFFGHPACFTTKMVYKKMGSFNEEYSIAADYEFILRCYVKGIEFQPVDYCIANFSHGGISTSQPLKCAIESTRICLRYIEFANDRKMVIDRRIKNLANVCMLNLRSKDLKRILGSEKCVIFGDGIWGKRIEELCIRNGINVEYYVDNDSKKWSLKTRSPEALRDYDGTVVVAMDNHTKEVSQQIIDNGNSLLHIVWLEDLRKLALDCIKKENQDVCICMKKLEEYKVRLFGTKQQ